MSSFGVVNVRAQGCKVGGGELGYDLNSFQICLFMRPHFSYVCIMYRFALEIEYFVIFWLFGKVELQA